jgi:hypothetical protein
MLVEHKATFTTKPWTLHFSQVYEHTGDISIKIPFRNEYPPSDTLYPTKLTAMYKFPEPFFDFKRNSVFTGFIFYIEEIRPYI